MIGRNRLRSSANAVTITTAGAAEATGAVTLGQTYLVTCFGTAATNAAGAAVTFSGTAVSATAHKFIMTPGMSLVIVADHATARIIRLGSDDVRVSFLPISQE